MAYDITREKITIDAQGKSVGEVASKASHILQGKNKPTYKKHVDVGDFVIIENAEELKFSGRKLVQKDYFSHTDYPGGLKRKPMKHVFEENPAEVVEKAVFGMLPKNKHRDERMKRLQVFAQEANEN
ncbi:MAG: 50S ribosomal protein L13 [Candidatus Magasanikbacteria bacterium]